jgi:predicted amidohydrolase
MRIAVIQNDPVFGEVEKNLDAARTQAAGVHADLVVFPELFATGYQLVSKEEAESLAEPAPGGRTIEVLHEIARASGATVVGGLIERLEDPFGRQLYNAAAIVTPSGFLTTYRKCHLYGDEPEFFARGPDLPFVVRTPQGFRVGVMICFDWRFPEVARHLALLGADVIAHPANLVNAVLPNCPSSLPVRCLENRVVIATADRVGAEARGERKPLRYIGQSQIVSARGERLAVLGEEGAGVATAEVDIAQVREARRADVYEKRRDDLFEGPGTVRGERPGGYAALFHEPEDGPPHIDLLFEAPGRGGRLIAFRAAPGAGIPGECERSFDHRMEYLEKEGDLGPGRGSARRVDRGTCIVREEQRDRLLIEVRGERLGGTFEFLEVEGDRWFAAPAD